MYKMHAQKGKQYRCRIKKEMLQICHAKRIDECCGKGEGPQGGERECTELNEIKHMYGWKQ